MNKKIATLTSFRGKLTAVIALLAMLSFNAQAVFAQASTQPTQKQTTTPTQQTKTTVKAKEAGTQSTQSKAKETHDPFNGKTFDVTLTEKGKVTGDKDKLIFAGKKFESTLCTAKGFPKSDYTIHESNGLTTFTLKAVSEKEGTMSWIGTLKGDTLSGTATLTKPDKTVVTYSFKGNAEGASGKNETKSTK